VALIEYIRWLDEQQPPSERFIINPHLGDNHLLVKVPPAQQGRRRAP
jgi:hypothetical protein